MFEMFYLFPKGRVVISYTILYPMHIFLHSKYAKNYYCLKEKKHSWIGESAGILKSISKEIALDLIL